MKPLTQILIALVLIVLIAVPVLGARSGWGLGTQADQKIIADSDSFCPTTMRAPDGTCRRTVRSYYFGRSFIGGGPRTGK
ncbi:MAG: hypothetical protein AAGE01_03375 [Pseudomonadota bacterium]